jgi:IS66 C-terminal element
MLYLSWSVSMGCFFEGAIGSPQAYLRDVLARIVARHPMGRIDELLPFAYVSAADKAAA